MTDHSENEPTKMTKITRKRLIASGLTSLLIFSIFPVGVADTVVLKNGRSFEGEIKQETDAQITLDMGLGTISFPRGNIKSIKRLDEAIPANNQWQRQNFTNDRYVPSELKEIASQYRNLDSKRVEALRARSRIRKLQSRRTRLFNELNTGRGRMVTAANRIRSMDPTANVGQYNRLVKTQNNLSSKLVVTQNTLEAETQETAGHRKTIGNYLAALSTFKDQYEKSAAEDSDYHDPQKAEFFLTELGKRLKKFDSEFKVIEVPHESEQGHTVVTVRINNQLDARFLLDTGASFVTLSKDVARKLNLDLASHQNLPLKLADGSEVNGQPVILNSMQVGEVRADGVVAMVLPAPPAPGLDGLLGMSFLREFVINFDPANDKLVFEKFEPQS